MHGDGKQGKSTQQGAILAVLGAAIALIGPNLGFGAAHDFSTAGWLFATVYMAEFEHTGLAAVQLSLGALSLVLALLVGALAIAQWRRPARPLAAGIVGGGVALLVLAWLTYDNVYALVPCDKLGLGLCDGNGGLVPGTWVQLNGVVWQVVGGLIAAMGGLWLGTTPIAYTGDERFLRARMQWNGEIIGEKLLLVPQPLTIGEDPHSALQVASSGLGRHRIAVPLGQGAYRLDIPAGVTGAAELNGHSVPLDHPCSKVLAVGDRVVLAFENGLELQLAFAAPYPGVLTPAHHNRDAGLIASFATVLSLAIVLFTVAASAPPVWDDSPEREALVAKSHGLIEVQIDLPQLELPPEDKDDNGKAHEDPAKRASGPEGKAGDPKKDPRIVTKLAKQEGPPRDKIDLAQTGLNKVLSAPQAMPGALGTVMAGDTGAIASKLNVAIAGDPGETVVGHGAGATGFVGIGSGGGGPEGPAIIRGKFDLPGSGDDLGRKANLALGRHPRKHVGGPIIEGKVETVGGCDKADIRKNVLSRAHAFRACYETALLSKPDLTGKVGIQWTIGGDGKVSGDKITSDTLDNSAVTDCVLRTVRRIQFAVPEAGVCVVAWPFVFNPN